VQFFGGFTPNSIVTTELTRTPGCIHRDAHVEPAVGKLSPSYTFSSGISLPGSDCKSKIAAVELTALYQRVIGLDVHQAQITTVCAIIHESERTTCVEQRQFGTFKRDRHELAV